ncbi:hypothetical protein CU633_16335 [Bacillus sp. V3-13]|uniref:hypothetical protein n=1 Tax=Bacillus sp. V3-13 TaxID=2053728 RepID=UPI000C7566A1|nr:hypothetical protein [Bacillus sp. V3-13]PLR76264.1 hypothetical protein CU633_16335 [Bacillus sp. V3-13]
MKKSIKNTTIAAAVLIPTLTVAISASAYSKGYTFDMAAAVYGSTNFALENKTTKTTANANTYWASGDVKSTKSQYQVHLARPLKTYVAPKMTANGFTYTESFGTVTKNDYNVNVYKSSAGDQGDRVKGSGTINQ